MIAGVNGWNYTITQGTNIVGNDSALYGQLTGQFAQLQTLWQTYRVDDVMLEFTPNTFSGSGYNSPIASIVDVGGPSLPYSTILELLTTYSRSRTLRVTDGLKPATRKLDYRNWLIQTCPQPWLITDDGSASGRQLYPD